MGQVVMLEFCRALKQLAHFTYASSSSVYGLNRTLPFAEDARVDTPSSLYAATKRSGELISHAYSHLYGVPQTGLRFFTVYGALGPAGHGVLPASPRRSWQTAASRSTRGGRAEARFHLRGRHRAASWACRTARQRPASRACSTSATTRSETVDRGLVELLEQSLAARGVAHVCPNPRPRPWRGDMGIGGRDRRFDRLHARHAIGDWHPAFRPVRSVEFRGHAA